MSPTNFMGYPPCWGGGFGGSCWFVLDFVAPAAPRWASPALTRMICSPAIPLS